MKKVLLQLVALLFCSGWCVQADAAWRMKTGEPIKEASGLKDGMYIVLENRCNADATGRLWSPVNTYDPYDVVQQKHVFRLVMLPDANPITGEPMIQLQSVETKKWWTPNGHFVANSQEDAGTLTVGRASKYTFLCKAEDWTEDNPVWTNDYREPAWDWKDGEALTFAGNITSTDDTKWTYLTEVWGWYNYCSWANYRDVNPWYAYEAEEYEDPVGDLMAVIEKCEAQKLGDLYLPGTSFGQCSPDLVEAYTTAFQTANELILDNNSTDEQLVEARKTLEKAAEALKASVILPEDGHYYYIYLTDPRFEQNQGEKRAWYMDKTAVRWGPLDTNDISCLFKLEKQEDGTFAIRSVMDNRYLSGATTVSDTPTTTQSFYPSGHGNFYIINGVNPSTGGRDVYHADGHGDGKGVSGPLKIWEQKGGLGTSDWNFMEFTDFDRLDQMREAHAQKLRTQEFNTQLTKARADSAGGYVMKNYIKNVNQLSTNAREVSGEGPIQNLIDGKYETYFHSSWSKFYGEPHHLQVRLNKPLQKFAVGYLRRHNTNNARPTQITVLGSNDGENFTEVAVMPQAPDTLPTADSQIEYRSSKAIDMGAPYTYIRFRVDSTNTMGLERASSEDPEAKRYPYFHFSEFWISDEGFPIDPESMAFRPDLKDAYAALKDAIDISLQKDLATVQQEDIDLLTNAIEGLAKLYPDTTVLSNAINKARKYTTDVTVSDEERMGWCKDQSKLDGLTNAVNEARAALDANPAMTRVEIEKRAADLDAVRDEFFTAVVTPEPGKWYFMESVCTDRVDDANNTNGSIVYADNNTIGAQVRWGGTREENGMMHPKYLWKFIPVEGKTNVYGVQNVGTGYYLGADRGLSTAYLLSDTLVEFKFDLVANGQLTLIQNREGAHMTHAQVNGKVLVPWDAGAESASAWTFIETSEDEQTAAIDAFNNRAQIYCLPYDVTGSFFAYNDDIDEETTAYMITDAKYDDEQNITEIGLTALAAGEEIKAGTPFIIILGDATAEEQGDTMTLELGMIVGSELNTDAQDANGLVGVMSGKTVEQAGIGYFSAGNGLKSLEAGKTVTIAGQNGYIDGKQIKATGKADLYLPVNEGTITDIKQAIKDAGALVTVYTADGQLVRKNVKAADALKGLKKGIYVVGGKTVSVK